MGEQIVSGRRAGFDRVFISGYFGFGNLGDEAILEAVVLELRKRHPSLAITATFGEDRSTAERLHVTPVDFLDLDASAHSIVGADLVLFGLGGVFQDYWGATSTALFRQGTNGVEAWARPALLARMEHIPVALFCAGVGPLRSHPGRAMFAMACEAADLLIVRDETSAFEVLDISPSAKPLVAADPAHGLEAAEEDRRYADAVLRKAGLAGAPISVAVRAWDLEVDRSHLVAQLAAGLDAISPDHPLVFLPFHCGAGTDDREVAEAIRAALPNRPAAVIAPRTAGQAIALLERSALAVAARNHGVVFAGCAKTPVIPIRYDPKVASCAAAVGVEDLLLGLDELDQLPATLSRALASRERLVQRMVSRRAGLGARIERGFDSLDGLLASRAETGSPLTGAVGMVARLRGERADLNERLREAGRHVRHLESLERDMLRMRRELRSFAETVRKG